MSLFGYAGVVLMSVALIFWGIWSEQFGIRGYPTRWSIEIAHLLPALATMLMLFFIFDPQSLGARLLSMGWLRFIGVISYEWFLFHGPVVRWFVEHNGPSHGNLLAYGWRVIAPLALTFVFSALVYRYFSLPILNGVRKKLRQG